MLCSCTWKVFVYNTVFKAIKQKNNLFQQPMNSSLVGTLVGGGWGWTPNTKEVLLGILERTPERHQDPALWVWLEMFFTLGETNFKTTHYFLLFFVDALNYRGYHKSCHCGPFENEHPMRYQICFLTPKGTRNTLARLSIWKSCT